MIVGAGLAGAGPRRPSARKASTGRVVLVGAEPQPPYERPPLSKEYLRGEVPVRGSPLPPARLLRRAEHRDPAWRPRARLDPPRGVSSSPTASASVRQAPHRHRRPQPPPRHRRPRSRRRLRPANGRRRRPHPRGARPGSKAVVVGMGFIGSEVAASLRQLGRRGRGRCARKRAAGACPRRGGRRRAGGDPPRAGGRAPSSGTRWPRSRAQATWSVVTTGRATIECDFVVVGVGVEPATELAGRHRHRARERHRRRRVLPDGRRRHLCGRRRREPLPPGVRAPDPRGALAERAQAGSGRRPEHAGKDEPYERFPGSGPISTTQPPVRRLPHELGRAVVRGSMEERSFVAFYCTDGGCWRPSQSTGARIFAARFR